MAKLIQLTTNSWIVKADTPSLLFKVDDGYLSLSPTTKLRFNSLEDVQNKFGKLEYEDRKADTEAGAVNGFPVKHTDITIVSEDPPLYTRGGNVVYAGGYWGLKFTNGWTQAYCPKQDTCQKYESVGPFKNRLEMLNHLSMLNTTAHLKGQQ